MTNDIVQYVGMIIKKVLGKKMYGILGFLIIKISLSLLFLSMKHVLIVSEYL